MRLITAHRILIVAAIAFFVLFAGLKAQRYLGSGGGSDLVHAVVSVVVAAGLGAYYRSLSRWGRR